MPLAPAQDVDGIVRGDPDQKRGKIRYIYSLLSPSVYPYKGLLYDFIGVKVVPQHLVGEEV